MCGGEYGTREDDFLTTISFIFFIFSLQTNDISRSKLLQIINYIIFLFFSFGTLLFILSHVNNDISVLSC